MLWRAAHNTYIPTGEGFIYLADVIDIYSRRLLGWSIAEHLRTEICTDALAAALAIRGRQRLDGTIFHSDYAEVCVKPSNRVLTCLGGVG